MIAAILYTCLTFGLAGLQSAAGEDPYWEWPLSKAVKMLNSSAWARQETFTTVVGGVGSGRSGEKEIYSRFYVRFLSASPIREAYARILQIEYGYDRLNEEEQQRFDEMLQPLLAVDVDNWVVVAVSFRSNDPDLESQVRRYFHSETTATLRDKAFLSTGQFSQVNVYAYFPPVEEGVGAKFVFPREVGGIDLVNGDSGSISFELLDIPIARPGGGGQGGGDRGRGDGGGRGGGSGGRDEERNTPTILRATFSIEDMVVDGKPVY